MGNNARILWVDFLKGIAILWLIIYHFYFFSWLRSPVPVFFFLSGLFFSEVKPFGAFVIKKAKALLIPLLFFFVLGVATYALNSLVQGESYSFPALWRFATLIPADAKVTNPLGVGAIWFLASLFEVYLIYYLLNLISNNMWWLLIASVLLFFVSSVTMQIYGNGSLFYLFYSCGFVIYFVVADLLKNKMLYENIPLWILFLSVVAYSVRFISYTLTDSIGGGILLRINGPVSMFGLIFILVWFCKHISSISFLSNSRSFNFMLYEGRNSLTILGTHMLIMGVAGFVLERFMSVNVFYYLVLFIIVLSSCNICILVFNRYVPFWVNHKC